MRIEVIALGGTIAMAQDAHGRRAVPGAAPDALGEQTVPSAGGVSITRCTLADLPSPSLRPADLARALTRARTAVDEGAAGVVITHGTDTLEESAFLLNRLWDRPEPLVLTGAMRPAGSPGSDGPANLRDAVLTAADPGVRDLGVLVVLDGQVHGADQVTKAVSRHVGAFTSAPSGPIASVTAEGLARLGALLPRPVRPGGDLPETLPRVPVLALGLGDDAELLDLLPADAMAGLVIAGLGVGHVPAPAVPRLHAIVRAGIPVVVATRIPAGGTSREDYAYPGSEVDLRENGCLLAGRLRPSQARLLLQLLLARGVGPEEIAAALAEFGA